MVAGEINKEKGQEVGSYKVGDIIYQHGMVIITSKGVFGNVGYGFVDYGVADYGVDDINFINAERINKNYLINIFISSFDKNLDLQYSIKADQADIKTGKWELQNVTYNSNNEIKKYDNIQVIFTGTFCNDNLNKCDIEGNCCHDIISTEIHNVLSHSKNLELVIQNILNDIDSRDIDNIIKKRIKENINIFFNRSANYLITFISLNYIHLSFGNFGSGPSDWNIMFNTKCLHIFLINTSLDFKIDTIDTYGYVKNSWQRNVSNELIKYQYNPTSFKKIKKEILKIDEENCNNVVNYNVIKLDNIKNTRARIKISNVEKLNNDLINIVDYLIKYKNI